MLYMPMESISEVSISEVTLLEERMLLSERIEEPSGDGFVINSDSQSTSDDGPNLTIELDCINTEC